MILDIADHACSRGQSEYQHRYDRVMFATVDKRQIFYNIKMLSVTFVRSLFT